MQSPRPAFPTSKKAQDYSHAIEQNPHQSTKIVPMWGQATYNVEEGDLSMSASISHRLTVLEVNVD